MYLFCKSMASSKLMSFNILLVFFPGRVNVTQDDTCLPSTSRLVFLQSNFIVYVFRILFSSVSPRSIVS